MEKGKPAKNLISELDLKMLKIIDKKAYPMWGLRDALKINPLSAKRHVNRLEKLKLVKRERIEKTNRARITITQYGKDLLKLFDKLLKN